MDDLVSEPMRNTGTPNTNKYVNGRAQWELAHVILFCDLCKKETDDGNRRGGGMKQLSWKTIATKFNNENGLSYDGTQMKHKWDSLIKDWRNWRTLKKLAIGLGCNSQKGTIDASDDWWEKSIKANSEIKKFRTKDILLEVEEKLEELFFGAVAKGDYMWAPLAGRPPNRFFKASLTTDSRTEENNNGHISGDEAHIDSTIQNSIETDNHNVHEASFSSEVAQDLVRKRQDGSSTQKQKQSCKKVKGGASMLSTKIDGIKKGIENHKNAIIARVNKLPPTISDAVEVLMSIEEDIPPCSELYRFATKLLLNKDKREMFMALKNNSTRLWYLKEEAREAATNEAQNFTGLLRSQQYSFSS